MSENSAHPRRGLVVRARWQDRCLWSQVLGAQGAQAFTVGSTAGCDFTLAERHLGASALTLACLTPEGPRVRFTPRMQAMLYSGPRSQVLEPLDGEGLALGRGERLVLSAGPITFEVHEARVPSRSRASPLAGLDWAFLDVLAVMGGVFGVLLVVALNRSADVPPNDELDARSVQVAKRLVRPSLSAAGGAPAPGSPKKKDPVEPPAKQPRAQHARPALAQPPRPVDVKGLLGGVMGPRGVLGDVLSPGGLGADLHQATQGLQQASVGPSGMSLRGGGSGGPGGELQGIGGLGTRGKGGGHDGYGSHALCEGKACRKDEQVPTPGISEVDVGCAAGAHTCLDKELIRKVIKSNLGGIRACYEYELGRAPSLGGTVAVKFVIAPSGLVSRSDVAHSSTGSASLDDCVARRVNALQFPALDERGMASVVTYPFHFQRSGGGR